MIVDLLLIGVGVIVATMCAFVVAVDVVQVRRARGIATAPIASAKGGQFVQICGEAVVGEQGTCISPISKRSAVVFCVTTHARDEYEGGNAFREAREFLIDDGSGQRAAIVPARARLLIPPTCYNDNRAFISAPGGRTLEEMTPEMTDWARKHSGISADVIIEETIVAPGDRLQVLGVAQRNAEGLLELRDRGGFMRDLVLAAECDGGMEIQLKRQTAGMAFAGIAGAVAFGAGVVRLLS